MYHDQIDRILSKGGVKTLRGRGICMKRVVSECAGNKTYLKEL